MTIPYYDFHIFICRNTKTGSESSPSCGAKGADALIAHMKKQLSKLKTATNIRVNKSGCLGECNRGIALVIYPQNVWYSMRDVNDINRIIDEHILEGKIIDDLRML